MADKVKVRANETIGIDPTYPQNNILQFAEVNTLISLSNQTDDSMGKLPIMIYYFDFECLPATYEESLTYDAESITTQEPSSIIQQYKVINGEKALIASTPMKRTKRAFNVYKCIVDTQCQIIKITTTENIKNSSQISPSRQSASNQKHTQSDSCACKLGQQGNQKQPQVQKKEYSSSDQLNGKFINNNVEEQKAENLCQCHSEIKQQLQDQLNSNEVTDAHKCSDNNQSTSAFEDLEFENPYFNNNNNNNKNQELDQNQEGKQNNRNRSRKARLVIYNKKLIEVKQRQSNKSVIITTDLGGTLCGIPEATEQFMRCWIQYFWFDKTCKLIYNSGRGIHPFNIMMRREKIILPDYYIGRCGSFIFLKDYLKGFLYLDKQWMNELSKIWKPKLISEKMEVLSDWLKMKVRNEAEVWSIRYNSEIDVYYQREEEFKNIQKQLNEIGVEFNTIVREKQNLMHLEIVPSITDKGFALEYLLHKVYFPYISKLNQKLESQQNLSALQRQQEVQSRNMTSSVSTIQNKVQLIKTTQFSYQDILINNSDPNVVIAAFGDTMNDDGMLKLANISICVSNSEKQLIHWVNSKEQQTHPQLSVSEHSNGYALLEFIKQYID